MSNSSNEIVVVGGGVIGTSIAYHLAMRGARVTLLERGQLAAQASGATAGGVRQFNRDARETPLAIASIARWHSLEDELEADIEFRTGGQLSVADTEESASTLHGKVARERQLGVWARFVEGPELRELAPDLAPGFLWGMHTTNDGQASGSRTTHAFGAAAARFGARIQSGSTVRSIVRSAERVVGVETDTGPVACDWLVLAAGAWSRQLASTLGVNLPITTMALQMMAVGPAEPVLAPTVGALGRRLSLKQTPGGSFVIGGGWPGDADLEQRVGRIRLDSIRGSIEHATSVLPLLRGLPLKRAWIGLEALTLDGVPILGSIPGIANATLATGFSGHGFALSPIVGQLVSEQIVDGAPSLPIDAFRVDRFAGSPADAAFPDWEAG